MTLPVDRRNQFCETVNVGVACKDLRTTPFGDRPSFPRAIKIVADLPTQVVRVVETDEMPPVLEEACLLYTSPSPRDS